MPYMFLSNIYDWWYIGFTAKTEDSPILFPVKNMSGARTPQSYIIVGIGTPEIRIAFSRQVSRRWLTAFPNASAGGPPSSVSNPHSHGGSSSRNSSRILDFASVTALAKWVIQLL